MSAETPINELAKERDQLKAALNQMEETLLKPQQSVDKVIEENKQLRAEVESETRWAKQYLDEKVLLQKEVERLQCLTVTNGLALCEERDAWREDAGRLARWLRVALEYCEAIDAGDTVKHGDAALAAHEKVSGTNSPHR